MPLSSGNHLGAYEILGLLGTGGMGEVYRARDPRLGRQVAIKILPEHLEKDAVALARFEQEARAVAALNHPGIVTIHSVEEEGGVRFLTMELVEGRTLDSLISPGPMPVSACLDIASQLASALSAAHEKGVIHRDLKPLNVMVGEGGRVKVLDFGLARRTGAESAGVSEASNLATAPLTAANQMVGTLPYMSPEQLQGKPLDARSDIFSLGVILHEMVSGARPFHGASQVDLASAILRDPPPPIPSDRAGVSADLLRVMKRCLEKDPRRRYQTVLDVANEIEEMKSGGRSAAGLPGSRLRWFLIAALGIGVAGVTGIMLMRQQGPPAVPDLRSATAAPAAIAILPFENLSGDARDDYFGEGISEDLINALGRVKGLQVAGRSASFALKGQALPPQETGKRLGVSHVLEGSVQRAGDTLRITARLVTTSDGFQIWSERFDRRLADVFAIQDEISSSIVESLKVALTPEEQRALKRAKATDVEAYDLYLQGRRLFHRTGRENYDEARDRFSRAIAIDPDYALAWAGLADTSSMITLYIDASKANVDQAIAASSRALALAPDLAEAHASSGLALSVGRQHVEADRAFEEAERLDPRLYEAWYFHGRNAFAAGDHAKAVRLFARAAQVRPDDYQALGIGGSSLNALGRYDEAREWARRMLVVIEEQLKSDPADVRAIYMGGGAHIQLGHRDEGLAWTRRALALDPTDPGVLYNIACGFSQANEPDEAISALGKAIDAGFAHRSWLENDSDLKQIRPDPRFKGLLDRLK